jgi:EAL domain-containing protein (putative c-di-GMP-specific phosphodiesterase class I)/PAS domain-containing protein
MSAIPFGAASRAISRPCATWTRSFGLGSSLVIAAALAILAIGIDLAGAGTWVHQATFLAVNGGAAIAIFAGLHRNKTARPRAWQAIGTAMAVYTIADASTIAAARLANPTIAAVGQGLYVLGYPLFIIAAIAFARGTRRFESSVLVDTAIIGLGSVLLAWELLLEPNMPANLDAGAVAASMAYPVAATLVVTFLLPLVLVAQTRSSSSVLLVAGLACIGVADTRLALALLTQAAHADAVSNASWLAGYVALGLAGFVPSAGRVGADVPARTPRRDALRLVGLSISLVVPPLVILSEADTVRGDELRLFAVVAVLLAGLIVIRLRQTIVELISSDTRLRRFMSHDGILAVIKDGEGRYRFMNAVAESAAHRVDGEWYGRTDTELALPAVAELRRAADNRVRTTGQSEVVTQETDGRTWVVERFVIPEDQGSVGVLGIDITGRVQAETRLRLAEQAADRLTSERALIADTLAALDSGRTADATAQAVCERITQLPEIGIASLMTFGVDGIATVIGQDVSVGQARPGWRIPAARSAYLRERASAGPWVERWVAPPDHPYASLIAALAVRAHAFAPLVANRELVGILVVGSSAPDAVLRLTERLPALAEFAQITSALLAPELATRHAAERAEASVREIIDGGLFDIAFQPIVDLKAGVTPGYEALARFHNGTAPDEQFRLAREIGLGRPLALACIRRAIEAAEVRLGPNVWLNLNVSAEVVLTDGLSEALPADDRVVVLEITEHEAITNYEAFRAAVANLDGRVKLAIDDAGAGFASLRHIVELDPAFVKLDRSLVAGVGSDAARQAVVAGMVRFAETAGLTLIAEGIETEDELAALRRGGVTLGQGYLLGRPEVPPRVARDEQVA